ncbi:MAG: DUF2330 domain-containing protein [Pseudonocardiaceae bacterium]
MERGGDWTLQRLSREVNPVALSAAADGAAERASAPAEVLLETRIDALDITVLKGGAEAVGTWAIDHGFLLTPDAPEVLDFYASRSPIFMAARFDADAAREKGVALGDGTPIHLTIPTDNPWVPLRILGLGRKAAERIEADVFLLTDARPALMPGDDSAGMRLARQEPASESLMLDLRSDKGMEWMPEKMWLSFLRVDASPAQLDYDLAVDVSGAGTPSRIDAGLAALRDDRPQSPAIGPASVGIAKSGWAQASAVALGGLLAVGLGVVVSRRN